jgi:ribose/xylose/arabinose/galactoside ABC-type transport system permease subunit
MTQPARVSAMPGAARESARRLSRLLGAEALPLVLSGILLAALAPFTPGLLSQGNLENILANLLPLFIVALGQTLVLISGGIDLSQTSAIALTSVVGAFVMNGDTGWLQGSPLAAPAAVVVMLLLGALIGAANGFAVTALRMPPFMVTLTAMMFLSGLAIWLTRSRNIHNLPAGFVAIGSRLLPSLLLASAVGIIAHLALSRALPGRWLYAVGQNPRAAAASGVPVARVIVAAYAASGILAVASILYTGRLETASPVHGQRILLDVIGATVIGGVSLFGGRGRVAWTLYGALFLALLDNGLNLLGLSHFTVMMSKGGVILLAAALDTARHRWRSARG